MFNPFKKNDNSFKLDDISLPSLNEEPNPNSELPSLEPPITPENPSLNNELSNPALPELPSLDSPVNSDPLMNPAANIGTPAPNPNGNPMLNPSQINEPTQPQESQIQNDITKAQLETMMSKINLMDARQQNMEQKLEMIYQIILNEVSEDTRRKLNIDSMMNKIKNQ